MQKGIDFIGLCVVYFCHDGKGDVVMAKRSQNARDEKGLWDVGGGAIELHDTIDNTLRKEIKEEYNCDVLNYEFLGYRELHRRIDDDKKTHWIALDFKVLVEASDLKTNEPHKFDDVKLFPIGEMLVDPEKVHSQLPKFLEKYQDKIKNP
jgi:8-oxo-dGTP diphosphatase